MIAHPIETAKMAAFPVAGVIDPSDYTPEANGLKKAFQEHPEEATEGTVGSVLGGAELGGLGGEVAKELPTRANAGRLFTSISRDAADQPVSLTRAQPHIAKMLQLGKEGGGAVPPPVRQLAAAGGQGTPRSVPLLRAMQDELNGTGSAAPAKPLLYPSARNFQSGLASLSRDDIGKMSGPMRGSLKQLNKAFYGDVNDAASAVGRGEDYAKAMRNYRIASTVGDVASKAKKYAVPAALGAAGAGAGYKLARALMPDR
jgi:hypothetical protein